MSEIGNYYDSYRRSHREREAALAALAKARRQEAEKERLVRQGKLRKVVTYDPIQRLTTIHYEKVVKK
ncbi:MAG: hypothetical protein IJ640_00185 [Prevotella sp.]|nr:hypothetical protein [Prevotella sp.]